LGGWGFSGVLTMVSAIASRTSNNFALMAILSFPVVLPILLIVMKVTNAALNGGGFADNWSPLMALFLLNIMIAALASVLFPYLWKD
jgi:heme exporter protein B